MKLGWRQMTVLAVAGLSLWTLMYVDMELGMRKSMHCSIESVAESELTNLDPLVLVKAYGESSCEVQFTFVREFYVPAAEPIERFWEILNSTMRTIMHNPRCSKFKLLVADPAYAVHLREMHDAYPEALIEAWWAPGGVTFSRILLAAKQSGTPFVLSTGDTVIGPLALLPSICAKAFSNVAGPQLFVVSRRDLGHADCEYMKRSGSWDVFIGTTTEMISDDVLSNTVFKPQYWGSENIIARQLFPGPAINLCHYVDVVHMHAVRSTEAANGGPRIRINTGDNSFSSADGAIELACDATRIDELKVRAAP